MIHLKSLLTAFEDAVMCKSSSLLMSSPAGSDEMTSCALTHLPLILTEASTVMPFFSCMGIGPDRLAGQLVLNI